jgi:hypothetical protein
MHPSYVHPKDIRAPRIRWNLDDLVCDGVPGQAAMPFGLWNGEVLLWPEGMVRTQKAALPATNLSLTRALLDSRRESRRQSWNSITRCSRSRRAP